MAGKANGKKVKEALTDADGRYIITNIQKDSTFCMLLTLTLHLQDTGSVPIRIDHEKKHNLTLDNDNMEELCHP
jgi:hypothetical protein